MDFTCFLFSEDHRRLPFANEISLKLDYSLTDNSSKTMQKEKMSAVSGQRLASLTAKTIENMRKDLIYCTKQLVKKQKKWIIRMNQSFPENDASHFSGLYPAVR